MHDTPLKAVVFDFDGTLAELTIDFDMMRLKVASLAEAFLDRRPDPRGRPVLEWVEELKEAVAKLHGVDTGLEFATRCRFLIMEIELAAADAARPHAGAIELLDDLRRSGVRTAIITRNTGAAVRRVMADVDRRVDALLAREDVPRVKPDPDHLLRALALVGSTPGASLMVGDHALDIQCGKAAGTLTAAVVQGVLDRAALAETRPDFLVDDLAGLRLELGLMGVLE